MAKLAELIDELAPALGLPRTAIEAYAKPLRKAGLISSAGRTGPGSPEMTPADAANLLIAIGVGKTTKAAEAVKAYGELKVKNKWCDDDEFIIDDFYDFLELEEEHTLFDLIHGIIKSISYSVLHPVPAHIVDFHKYVVQKKIFQIDQMDERRVFIDENCEINWWRISSRFNIAFTTDYPYAIFNWVIKDKANMSTIAHESVGYSSVASNEEIDDIFKTLEFAPSPGMFTTRSLVDTVFLRAVKAVSKKEGNGAK